MVLRAGDGVGQGIQAQLLQAGQELLQMLAAEMRKDEAPRVLGAQAADQCQDQPRHQGVVEPGYGLVARDVFGHDGSIADHRRENRHRRAH